VRYASIMTIMETPAERPDGTVMGAKRLKAIVIRGTKGFSAARQRSTRLSPETCSG